MSIFIKGMDMPENCGKCRFAGVCVVHSVEEWPDLESIMFNEVIGVEGKRDPDCPLVEVPAHGRLVDADAFSEEMKKRQDAALEWRDDAKDEMTAARADAVLSFLCEVKLTLDKLPTVIPEEP